MDWLLLIVGLLVGAGAAWLLGRAQVTEVVELRRLYDAERVAHAKLQSKQEETEKRLVEQQAFVEKSKSELANVFSTLSRDALNVNRKDFVELAKTRLETLLASGKGDLDSRKEAIDNLLKPLSNALKDYQKQTQDLEKSLKTDYGSLSQHLKDVVDTNKALEQQTASLDRALRTPQVRGKWGELSLRRAAELAGMSEHVDFLEQVAIETDEGRKFPDMIVKLPGDRNIIVDAKAPIVAFLDALEAKDEEERQAHIRRHAQHIRIHMKQLSSRSYDKWVDQTPDIVVMYIPGESFFSAALEVDHDLIETGMRARVILASPTTFVALMRAVEMGWQQQKLAENAMKIWDEGKVLYERLRVFSDHFNKVGTNLGQAVSAYDDAVGSFDRRVISSAKKFRELGVTSQDEIPDIPQIDRVPRSSQAEFLPSDDSPESD